MDPKVQFVDDIKPMQDTQLLRVRGIEGLRVADASIMPTMLSANLNAASLMIGDKAFFEGALNVDTTRYFGEGAPHLAVDRENMIILANPVLPHSEGEIVLESADPMQPPSISMNYFGDPYDLKVMVAVIRKALAIADNWPGPNKPIWQVPPELAKKHGYKPGETPSDALLENIALHFCTTVYHLTCTCRIGDVVDPRLNVYGVKNLRVADASVMRETASFVLPPSLAMLEPGDAVAVNFGAVARDFRIVSLTDGAARKVEAVRVASAVYDAPVATGGFKVPAAAPQFGKPAFELMNLPLPRDGDDPAAFVRRRAGLGGIEQQVTLVEEGCLRRIQILRLGVLLQAAPTERDDPFFHVGDGKHHAIAEAVIGDGNIGAMNEHTRGVHFLGRKAGGSQMFLQRRPARRREPEPETGHRIAGQSAAFQITQPLATGRTDQLTLEIDGRGLQHLEQTAAFVGLLVGLGRDLR